MKECSFPDSGFCRNRRGVICTRPDAEYCFQDPVRISDIDAYRRTLTRKEKSTYGHIAHGGSVRNRDGLKGYVSRPATSQKSGC